MGTKTDMYLAVAQLTRHPPLSDTHILCEKNSPLPHLRLPFALRPPSPVPPRSHVRSCNLPSAFPGRHDEKERQLCVRCTYAVGRRRRDAVGAYGGFREGRGARKRGGGRGGGTMSCLLSRFCEGCYWLVCFLGSCCVSDVRGLGLYMGEGDRGNGERGGDGVGVLFLFGFSLLLERGERGGQV